MYDYFTQLNHYLESSEKKYSKKTALIVGDMEFSYQDVNEKSNQLANYLISQGLLRGDRVVVSTGNTYESVISFWATLKAGGIVCLINSDTSSEKINYVLNDSGAKVFIGRSDQYYDIQKNVLLDKYSLKIILLSDEFQPTPSCLVKHLNAAFQDVPCDNLNSAALDIDLATIIYTSGSTGEPKGVMLTHRNMLAASTSINQYLKHSEKDIIISVLPISFDYGLYQMIMAFSVGATLILEKNFMWPAQLLKRIFKYKATVLPVVPSMVPLLKQHGEKFSYNLSSLRCITNTGAALNIKHINILRSQFSSAEIYSMYGLTECKRCTYLPPHMIDKKPTSVGIAIPNTELWVIDELGNRLAANQVGQLVIRGSTIMKGYWNKPEKTNEKLKDGPLPSEKLLYTGDYCYLDEDGYLYFQGRMDEVLKCRGIKVSPREVEALLMQHPDIIEAAIIGVDDVEWGTVIHAFIALSKDASKDELHLYCQYNLSAEVRPKYFTVLNSLPKSSNGKIDKLSLKNFLKNESNI